MSDPVRWGVLGPGRFAQNRWLPAFTHTPGVEGITVASRDPERARGIARKYGFRKAFGSYDELLADPAIEAVYLPLPNGLHGPWALKAIAAGKHVLTEKPAWASADEGRRVAEAASVKGLRVMEAFMIRHHARWKRVMELIASDTIGAVKSVLGAFCFTLDDAANFRWDPALAGGALADVGCYPINIARMIFNEEPVQVLGVATDTEGVGVDSSFAGLLSFPSGAAAFRSSFEERFEQSLSITGSKGEIVVNRPFICRDEPVVLTIRVFGEKTREERIPLGNQYVDEITHFSACVRNPLQPLWPGEDGIASAEVLDALRRSAACGQAVQMEVRPSPAQTIAAVCH